MSTFSLEWLDKDAYLKSYEGGLANKKNISNPGVSHKIPSSCTYDIQNKEDELIRSYLDTKNIRCGMPENYGIKPEVEISKPSEIEEEHEYQAMKQIDLAAYERYLEYLSKLKKKSVKELEEEENVSRVFKLRFKIIKFLYEEEKAGKVTGLYTLDELDKKGVLKYIIELAELDSKYSTIFGKYSIDELVTLIDGLKDHKDSPVTAQNILIKMRLNQEDEILKVYDTLNQDILYEVALMNSKLNWLYSNTINQELETEIKTIINRSIKMYKDNPDAEEGNPEKPPIIVDEEALNLVNKVTMMSYGELLYMINPVSIYHETKKDYSDITKELTGKFLPNYDTKIHDKEKYTISKVLEVIPKITVLDEIKELMKSKINNKDNLLMFFDIKSIIVDETVELEDLMTYTTLCSSLMFKLVQFYVVKKKSLNYEDVAITDELDLKPKQLERLKQIFNDLSKTYLNKVKYNELTSRESREIIVKEDIENLRELHRMSTIELPTSKDPVKFFEAFPSVEVNEDSLLETIGSAAKSFFVGVAAYTDKNNKAIKKLKDVLGITRNHVMSMNSDVLVNVYELLLNSKYRDVISEGNKFNELLDKYNDQFKFSDWLKDLLYPVENSKYSKINNTVRAFAKDVVNHLKPVVEEAVKTDSFDNLKNIDRQAIVNKYNDMGIPIGTTTEPGFETKVMNYAMNLETSKALMNNFKDKPFVSNSVNVIKNFVGMSTAQKLSKQEVEMLTDEEKKNVFFKYDYNPAEIDLVRDDVIKLYTDEATKIISKDTTLKEDTRNKFIKQYVDQKMTEYDERKEASDSYDSLFKHKVQNDNVEIFYHKKVKTASNVTGEGYNNFEFTSAKPLPTLERMKNPLVGDSVTVNKHYLNDNKVFINNLPDNNKLTNFEKQKQEYDRVAKERIRQLKLSNRRMWMDGTKHSLAMLLGSSKAKYDVFEDIKKGRVTGNLLNALANVANEKLQRVPFFRKVKNAFEKVKRGYRKVRDGIKYGIKVFKNKAEDVKAFVNDVADNLKKGLNWAKDKYNKAKETFSDIMKTAAPAVGAISSILGLFSKDAAGKVSDFAGGLSSLGDMLKGAKSEPVTFYTPDIVCKLGKLKLNNIDVDVSYTQLDDYYEEMDYITGDKAIRNFSITIPRDYYLKLKLNELPSKGFPIELIREFSYTPVDGNAIAKFTPENRSFRVYSIMDNIRHVYTAVLKNNPMPDKVDTSKDKLNEDSVDKVTNPNQPVKTISLEFDIIPNVVATKNSPSEFAYPLVSFVNLEMNKSDVIKKLNKDKNFLDKVKSSLKGETFKLPVPEPTFLDKIKTKGWKNLSFKDYASAANTIFKAGVQLFKTGKELWKKAKNVAEGIKKGWNEAKVFGKNIKDSFKKYFPKVYDYFDKKFNPKPKMNIYDRDEYFCANIMNTKLNMSSPVTDHLIVNNSIVKPAFVYSVPKDRRNVSLGEHLSPITRTRQDGLVKVGVA